MTNQRKVLVLDELQSNPHVRASAIFSNYQAAKQIGAKSIGFKLDPGSQVFEILRGRGLEVLQGEESSQWVIPVPAHGT